MYNCAYFVFNTLYGYKQNSFEHNLLLFSAKIWLFRTLFLSITPKIEAALPFQPTLCDEIRNLIISNIFLFIWIPGINLQPVSNLKL